MTMHEAINSRFPVRKTKAQKEAFRSWVLETAKGLNYVARVEEGRCVCSNHNVVIGDPEKAEVIVTAHYDTPAVMPLPNLITPRNMPVYLGYQLLIVAVFFAATFLVSWCGRMLGMSFDACYWLGMAVYMALLLMMIAGPANRHNANDNTSGVATVLQLMEELPPEQRDKAAFILFDNEEKGMLGSTAYAGKHKAVKREKLLINLDCVGVGEDILFFAPKKARALPAYGKLTGAMAEQGGKRVNFFPLEKSVYPSDQAQFTHGIAVCACKKNKYVGFYCSRLHTPKDTECDHRCLDALAQGLAAFVSSL